MGLLDRWPTAISEPFKRWAEAPPRIFIGVALTLIGAGAVVVSTAFDAAPAPRVVGGDRPVNAGAGHLGDISAHNSPAVARNPVNRSNLVVANRIDSPRFSCALHVSLDGGRSWRTRRGGPPGGPAPAPAPFPIPRGEDPKCYAPDVSFAPDGTMYMSFVTLRGGGNLPNAVWTVSSKDGGRTLSKPRKALGRLRFQVRLVADPVNPGRLYLTWLEGASGVGLFRFSAPGNPIRFARSDDGGRTWTRPARVSAPARRRAVAPSLAAGPKGELYVLYLDLGDDRLDYEAGHQGFGGPPYPGRFKLVLARSLDGGATWGESIVDDGIVPTERFVVFLPPFPSLAVDRRGGRVYAGFHDGRLGDPDVWVWSLRPGGAAWEGPTRVNDTPERDGTSQYLPRLAVAPDGRLDAIYYDRRGDPRNARNGVSLQSSFDGGESFTERVDLSSRRFDPRVGYGSEREMPDLGNRIGLVSDAGRSFAVWSDTRAGTVDNGKQDLSSALVAFSTPPRLSEPVEYGLRWGGLAVALAGLAVLATGVWRARARATRG